MKNGSAYKEGGILSSPTGHKHRSIKRFRLCLLFFYIHLFGLLFGGKRLSTIPVYFSSHSNLFVSRSTLHTHNLWSIRLLAVISSRSILRRTTFLYPISFYFSFYLRSDRETQPPARAPGICLLLVLFVCFSFIIFIDGLAKTVLFL